MKQSVSSMRARLQSEVRTSLRMLALAGTVLALACMPVADALSHSSARTPSSSAGSITTRSTLLTHISAAPVTTQNSSPAVLPCTPVAMPHPTTLDLTLAPAGVSQLTEPTEYYTIYGNDALTLQQQIAHCAPGSSASNLAEFTAQTAYNLTWQYGTTVFDDGTCQAGNVKIGVHTQTVLPSWQPGTDATPGLAARWSNFAAALAVHEQGHASLAADYAGQILADVSAVPVQSCDTLTSTLNAVIQNDAAGLSAASERYDTQTNHGATQGAVLPTN